MNKTVAACSAFALLFACGISSCKSGGGPAPENLGVYVMTNSPSDNSILVFNREDSGLLKEGAPISTQGNGSGSSPNPLNSQGALALSGDKKWLLAVNAGSNEISVLGVSEEGLSFASKTSSLGQFPVSLATSGNLVFVLNAKSSPPNITPFTIDNKGVLTSLPGGIRLLPPGNYSQAGFSPDGKSLIIAGNSNNLILVYTMNGNTPSFDPAFVESNGSGPAGFAFDITGNLLVVESGNNSISSYSVSSGGLKSITTSLALGQKTPRWVVSTGAFAFISNPGSNTVSALSISPTVRGQLTLSKADMPTATGNTELAVSSDGKYLYVLVPGSRAVDVFGIGADGSLTSTGQVPGLFGVFAQGIVAG
jgi:6-phosphogluconolactonase (cycloisomerase 2 family)